MLDRIAVDKIQQFNESFGLTCISNFYPDNVRYLIYKYNEYIWQKLIIDNF